VEETANAALRNRRLKQVVPGSGTPKHLQESCVGTSAATHSSEDFQGPIDYMTSLARAREGQSAIFTTRLAPSVPPSRLYESRSAV
jgi:hypothetical protein